MAAKPNSWVLQAGEHIYSSDGIQVGTVGAVTREAVLVDLEEGGAFWTPQSTILLRGQNGITLSLNFVEIAVLRKQSDSFPSAANDQDQKHTAKSSDSHFQA